MTSETPETKPDVLEAKASRPRIGGFVKRVRSMLSLNRGSSSREAPIATSSSVVEAVPREEQTTVVSEKEAAPIPMESAIEVAAEKDVDFYTATRQELFEQRAHAIFAKYDLVLEQDWMPLGVPTNDKTVERVHKPIRIRIHRYCHRCETVFGPDRICAKCQHGRCKKCPRYPREQQDTSRGRAQSKAPERRTKSETREPLLVIQSPRNCQILVHQPIVQRIRRICHKCQTQFSPATSVMCGNCSHMRCTRCPRDPAKKGKWASGYPGDMPPSSEEETDEQKPAKQERVFRKPRQRVRWHCDQCDTLFFEGSKTCRGCGHQKCDDCGRHPSKRNKENFDPVAVDSLHKRLSALAVASDSSS